MFANKLFGAVLKWTRMLHKIPESNFVVFGIKFPVVKIKQQIIVPSKDDAPQIEQGVQYTFYWGPLLGHFGVVWTLLVVLGLYHLYLAPILFYYCLSCISFFLICNYLALFFKPQYARREFVLCPVRSEGLVT